MSGHSKWSTIKRQKGVADIKRGATFTKLANAITIAARESGSGDPSSSPRLRSALDAARAVNMPKDNLQRAIDRVLGKLPGTTLDEVIYEGFGPGKVAFYIEGVTDNKLRTGAEIKNLFDKSGGNLGQGSTSYMFDSKGEVRIKTKGGVKDEEILELIDLGVEEVEDFEEDGSQRYLIYTNPSSLTEMSNKVTQSGFEVEESNLVMKPNITVNIEDPELARKVMEFTEKLEDNSDIQKVSANFDIPEEIATRLL